MKYDPRPTTYEPSYNAGLEMIWPSQFDVKILWNEGAFDKQFNYATMFNLEHREFELTSLAPLFLKKSSNSLVH